MTHDEARDDFEPLDKMTDHEYDGIREYDNPTPSWWSWIFFGTFVFSILYFAYYQIGSAGRTLDQSLRIAVATNQEKLIAQLPPDFAPNEETMLRYMNDDKWMSYAQNVYTANCVQCHGGSGEGLVGPNLTDDYYLNVKQLGDIIDVVTNGANNGNMPAHEELLSTYEITFVSAYVARLRDYNMKGRSPEGEIIASWPEPPPTIEGAPIAEPQS